MPRWAAADGLPVRVVAGVSVPMLWRVLGYSDNKSMDELVESAVAGAAQGALHASVSRRQNQATSPAAPMITTPITISNKLGLHARASAKLTKLAEASRATSTSAAMGVA